MRFDSSRRGIGFEIPPQGVSDALARPTITLTGQQPVPVENAGDLIVEEGLLDGIVDTQPTKGNAAWFAAVHPASAAAVAWDMMPHAGVAKCQLAAAAAAASPASRSLAQEHDLVEAIECLLLRGIRLLLQGLDLLPERANVGGLCPSLGAGGLLLEPRGWVSLERFSLWKFRSALRPVPVPSLSPPSLRRKLLIDAHASNSVPSTEK